MSTAKRLVLSLRGRKESHSTAGTSTTRLVSANSSSPGHELDEIAVVSGSGDSSHALYGSLGQPNGPRYIPGAPLNEGVENDLLLPTSELYGQPRLSICGNDTNLLSPLLSPLPKQPMSADALCSDFAASSQTERCTDRHSVSRQSLTDIVSSKFNMPRPHFGQSISQQGFFSSSRDSISPPCATRTSHSHVSATASEMDLSRKNRRKSQGRLKSGDQPLLGPWNRAGGGRNSNANTLATNTSTNHLGSGCNGTYRIKKPSRFVGGIWDQFTDSELEDSDGDGDDLECEFEQQKRIRVGSHILTVDDEQFVEGDSEDDSEDDYEYDSEDEDFEGFSSSDLNTNGIGAENERELKWTEKEDIKWCKGVINKLSFKFEHVESDEAIDDYFSPVDYFIKYVPESLFDDMVTYTNIYADQKNTKKWKPTDKTEIKTFIGLQIMMGNLKLPRIEMFYSRELQIKMFQDTIPLYRFYLLRTALHLIDVQNIAADNTDKFVRVRPLMNAVRNRCLQLPVEEYLSVDEQMIPMRGRVSKGVKQYVKNKPKIKWGIKNVVLCGKSGLAYDFVCYQGSTTEFDQEMLSTFGSGATMVLHLAKRITNSGHKLFFDNYFSTFQLFEILAQKKILAAGTIRLDRFAKPPFSSDSEMKKKLRGCSEEVVSSDGAVVCVKWFDNKCVALASNYVGIGTPDKAHRYDKSSKQKITVDRPQVVKDYNLNMGGVDLMNQMISYYRISIRSKKWTLRMITHFIDFAIIQSWIEYKIDCQKAEVPKRQIMDLLAFRLKLADQLVYSQTVKKRTTRITLDDVRSKQNRSEKREGHTDKSIRYDEINHFPECSESRMRCKLEFCVQKSTIYSEKCKVHLCLNKNNNCFRKYHKKS